MPAQWTAELIGEMHLNGVTAKALAAEAGWDHRYVSMVLNGHREPKKAEETLRAALLHIRIKREREERGLSGDLGSSNFVVDGLQTWLFQLCGGWR